MRWDCRCGFVAGICSLALGIGCIDGGVWTSDRARQSALWVVQTALTDDRSEQSATLMGDGNVALVGGVTPGGTFLASVEIFSPTLQAWTSGAPLQVARAGHASVLLLDGTILTCGGEDLSGVLASCELYDPVANAWSPALPLLVARRGATATRLNDGRVLLAGEPI